MKIWAHRGCSQRYPENTITAFARAMEIPKLTGIELDIQMTKDGEIVVIHDERVDRVTDGIGYVKDFTYEQLRMLGIQMGSGRTEQIPSIREVVDLLRPKMENGLLLNVELKNSIVPYNGMEEKIVSLVEQYEFQGQVIYSSFYTKSLAKIHKLDPGASVGILDTKVSDCFYKGRGCFNDATVQVALHPSRRGMDLTKEQLCGQTVRAWLAGHLYPEKPTGAELDLQGLEGLGITDVFLNEPERYLTNSG